MDEFYKSWVKIIDSSIVPLFDSILKFLKSKNGMYITIAIIVFFILY
jgi:uncharacterized membrane protein